MVSDKLSYPYDYITNTRTILLFENQYVWFDVVEGKEANSYNVRVKFDDYCTIILRNTSGLVWTFETQELAWAFVHSDYIINLHHIFVGVFKNLNNIIGINGDENKKSRLLTLYIKLGTHLKTYKRFDTLLNSKGQLITLPDSTKLTFVAKMQFGSVNYGSNEFGFELRLYLFNSVFIINFKSNEIGKIYDTNEEPSRIVNALDLAEFVRLINNRKQLMQSPSELDVELSFNTLDKFLEFFAQC